IRIGSVSGLPNSICLVCLLEFALSLDMSGWICSTSVMSASALNLTLHLLCQYLLWFFSVFVWLCYAFVLETRKVSVTSKVVTSLSS
ncbi:hypothetical protein Tco_0253402, partial [Tanacetum coccineum]